MSSTEPGLVAGSAEWIDLLEQSFRGGVARDLAPVDLTFSISETYRNVPPTVADHSVVAWTCRIENGRMAHFDRQASQDVDVCIVLDYAAFADLACQVIDGDGFARAQQEARAARARNEGAMTVSGAAPRAARLLLDFVHDSVARPLAYRAQPMPTESSHEPTP